MAIRKSSVGYFGDAIGDGIDRKLTVHHGLDCAFPVVTLYDKHGLVMDADIQVEDGDTITVTTEWVAEKDGMVIAIVG